MPQTPTATRPPAALVKPAAPAAARDIPVLEGVVLNLPVRLPTGVVPWPLVLVEGDEKSGKTWACALFSRSEHISAMYWIDLSEGSGDEYGAIPGARYQIVEHDGSFNSLYAAAAELWRYGAAVLAAGHKPICVVIDTMGGEWDLLKDWASSRARGSNSNKRKLAADPNAEIVVSTPYWNDANARHRKLMKLLKTFPGIVLMTAQGKEVAVMGQDGQPVEGKKEHKVEAQKALGSDASLWLRLYRDRPGEIVGGRSVHLDFKPGSGPKPLADKWAMESLIFDVLKCDPVTAQPRNMIEKVADVVTPEDIRDEICDKRTDFARLGELRSQIIASGYDDVFVVNETGDEETLMNLVTRIGRERQPAGEQAAGPAQPAPAEAVPETAAPLAAVPDAPQDPAPTANPPNAVLADLATKASQIAGKKDYDKLTEDIKTHGLAGRITLADKEALEKIIDQRRKALTRTRAQQPAPQADAA